MKALRKIAQVFVFLMFLGGVAQAQGNTTLTGSHYGSDYLFVLNPLWEDVQGSWGLNQYNLAWDSVYKELSGKTARVRQNVEFIPRELRVYGTVGCGYVDLRYSQRAPWTVSGKFCLDFSVNEHFDTEEMMKTWIETTLMDEVVVDFPEPTRVDVAAFLRELIEF